MHCIGQTNDQVILSYVESILKLGQKHTTPIFSISWSTSGTHNGMNYLQLIDNDYTKFMERLDKTGILEQSIVIFMGDHGYTYDEFRNTLLGSFEVNLPNMWILLPSWIKKEFPEWQNSLEINSR
jgi:membrane-anchored protein YejM (alkaline phosphatase superfamily)